MQYNVKIDAFEGPLDLLLHLINKYEIDIYDIPVSQITDQYMNYIHTMQELELDVASEYLVMAATLLAIKSKMLLPKREEEWFDSQLDLDMEEDPREDLINQLIEYKKYKHAAKELKERENDRSLIFGREPADLSAYDTNEKEQSTSIGDVTLYDMLSAFQRMFSKKKAIKPRKTTIQTTDIPIGKRMDEIMDRLSKKGNQRFADLFPSQERGHIVVTFLALLELMKKTKIHCRQEGNFSDIIISAMEKESI
ncbi:segregation/condensation protein A [Pseudalkalibacillus caeni]|uniref:Segregation and condensation protein A n=1 Tax=Exobacillus caeni TaxID=2574798 RepID=A0A5R9EXQ3_9BACL|nr:segregation/condensation protein A [Pseudalkalibacillus caeni]TLS35641.1 segregation/condensation protein A [Pseudalkalibacillus caeni]